MLAKEWLTNLRAYAAWETLAGLVNEEPDRAWRVVKLMVAHAPDHDLLGAVAAGPVEDLIEGHAAEMLAPILEEARVNARLRVCLQGVYSDLGNELRALVEAQTPDLRTLPRQLPADASAGDTSLMVAWFHSSDTQWAATFLGELTREEPERAWEVLLVLLRFGKDEAELREEIFLHAFDPFIRTNFLPYREQLKALALGDEDLRKWLLRERHQPIDDAASWTTFRQELSSARR
jgi:hypothetical protein